MYFPEGSGGPYQNLPSPKLGELDEIDSSKNGRSTFQLANFNMALLSTQINAL